MDWLLIVAGLLALLTSVIHLFTGGNDVATPLLKASLEREVKYALYACWHFVSVFFVASTLVFLLSGLGVVPESADLITGVSSLWLLFGVVFLVISLWVNDFGGVFRLPQWVLLFPVGLLGLVSRV